MHRMGRDGSTTETVLTPPRTGRVLACVHGTPLEVGEFQSLAPASSNEHDFSLNREAELGRQQLRVRFHYDNLGVPDVSAVQLQTQFAEPEASRARKANI